jgi:hypothetical protein
MESEQRTVPVIVIKTFATFLAHVTNIAGGASDNHIKSTRRHASNNCDDKTSSQIKRNASTTPPPPPHHSGRGGAGNTIVHVNVNVYVKLMKL